MLHSLRAGRKLPRTLVPIYSLAMVDMNICCTNMEKRQRVSVLFGLLFFFFICKII